MVQEALAPGWASQVVVVQVLATLQLVQALVAEALWVLVGEVEAVSVLALVGQAVAVQASWVPAVVVEDA